MVRIATTEEARPCNSKSLNQATLLHFCFLELIVKTW